MCKFGQILNNTCLCLDGAYTAVMVVSESSESLSLEEIVFYWRKSIKKGRRKEEKEGREGGRKKMERKKKGWLCKKSLRLPLSIRNFQQTSQSHWPEEPHVSQKQTAFESQPWLGAAHPAHGKCGFRACLWGDFRKQQQRPLDNCILQGDYYCCPS